MQHGEFVTAMVCNAASITVPSLRFCNSTYLQTISTTNPVPNDHLSYLDVNTIKDNIFNELEAGNYARFNPLDNLVKKVEESKVIIDNSILK